MEQANGQFKVGLLVLVVEEEEEEEEEEEKEEEKVIPATTGEWKHIEAVLWP